MNLILFDDLSIWKNLLPLTYTRPTAECRIGILTIREKWEKYLQVSASWLTQEYLSQKFPVTLTQSNLFVNGALCPDEKLIDAILILKPGQYLCSESHVLAANLAQETLPSQLALIDKQQIVTYSSPHTLITQTWELFVNNGAELRKDFVILTKDRVSQPLNDQHTITYCPENIFIEEGVKIRASVLNAENGPIYIGKNAEIREGSLIKGPFSMGEGAILNMGSKMRGDNTIGPFCKVGGEVSNSIFFERSNKLHDGFVGSSVIGSWCNLGGGTSTSNMKNNFGEIKVWNYANDTYTNTYRQFAGMIMGDFSKAGVNSMFNTGTVVGVSCNIFGGGFPPKFIPSFSWGGHEGFSDFKQKEAFDVIERNFKAIEQVLSQTDKAILTYILKKDEKYRKF